MEPCPSNHEQIMAELKAIKERMDKDWEYIEASKDDLLFRNRLWNILKWLGPMTIGGAIVRYAEYLFK